MSTLELDLEIDGSSESTLKIGALKVLEIVQPNWKNISYKIYTDGITNKLIGAWDDSNKDDQILMRVYGEKTDLFINRKTETENIKILHKYNLAPKLYATFKNGISYGFLLGTPLTTESIREERIWKSTAEQMAKFHKIKVHSKDAFLFEKLATFYGHLPDQFTAEQNERLSAVGLTKAIVKREIDYLRNNLDLNDCAVVFSHNDILCANIVWNEEKETVNFIDYEYGAPNYQPFDIGNYFNEFAGLDPVDYNLYPDLEFQKKWIRHYLSHFNDTQRVEQKEVERFAVLVNQFALASHIFWGFWALLQACNSNIEFDYLGYGIIRLKEYFRRKPLVFNILNE